MNAQATTCPPIQPVAIIADCLRELRVLISSIIYTYDGKFRPSASLRSLFQVSGGKIRQYNYDDLLLLLTTLWSGAAPIAASISIQLIGTLRVSHIYTRCNAATIALPNIRISKTNHSRSVEKSPHDLNQRHDYDARIQQVAQYKETRTQRREIQAM